MIQTLSACLLGIALGIRHALEPDHLVAVSTLIVETKSPRAGAALGIVWGVGHSVALLGVGCILALANTVVPLWLARCFELAVCGLFVLFGVRAILLAFRLILGADHHPLFSMGRRQTSSISRRSRVTARSLLVGVVHGLAGSGALTALAVAELPTAGSRLIYIAVFGSGSIIGMAILSGFAGAPLSRVARRPTVAAVVSAIIGVASVGCGLVWGLPLLWKLV